MRSLEDFFSNVKIGKININGLLLGTISKFKYKSSLYASYDVEPAQIVDVNSKTITVDYQDNVVYPTRAAYIDCEILENQVLKYDRKINKIKSEARVLFIVNIGSLTREINFECVDRIIINDTKKISKLHHVFKTPDCIFVYVPSKIRGCEFSTNTLCAITSKELDSIQQILKNCYCNCEKINVNLNHQPKLFEQLKNFYESVISDAENKKPLKKVKEIISFTYNQNMRHLRFTCLEERKWSYFHIGHKKEVGIAINLNDKNNQHLPYELYGPEWIGYSQQIF